MCDEWMPTIKLALTPEQFRELPRNPAYRYEYLDGQAYLSPRPKHYHAVLDLTAEPPAVDLMALSTMLTLRPLHDSDWPALEELFAEAFRTTQPFGSLGDAVLREASRQCLERTRTGGDGPLIAPACLAAVQGEQVAAAVVVTLIPEGDPCDSESYRWREPPPDDGIAQRRGRAHLTWIFVAPPLAGKGVGSTLLHASIRALRELGFTRLFSTFVLGNESSTLWHWRNGFALLAYPMSYRLVEKRRRQRRG